MAKGNRTALGILFAGLSVMGLKIAVNQSPEGDNKSHKAVTALNNDSLFQEASKDVESFIKDPKNRESVHNVAHYIADTNHLEGPKYKIPSASLPEKSAPGNNKGGHSR